MCKKLSTLLKQKRWRMLTAGLLVIVLLLAVLPTPVPFAYSHPFAKDDHETDFSKAQVPQFLLSRMTDRALIRTVEDCPMADLVAFYGLEFGYEVVKREYNGLQELERRFFEEPDRILELTEKRYEKIYRENRVNWEAVFLRQVMGMFQKMKTGEYTPGQSVPGKP